MKDLAIEYRESAALLKGRIDELSELLHLTGLGEMEKFRLRGRIETLQAIYRETNEIAVFMERYYDGGYRKNVRLTV
jgi:hypothetical protein